MDRPDQAPFIRLTDAEINVRRRNWRLVASLKVACYAVQIVSATDRGNEKNATSWCRLSRAFIHQDGIHEGGGRGAVIRGERHLRVTETVCQGRRGGG